MEKEWNERYEKYIKNIISIIIDYSSHGDKDLRDKQLKEVENGWYQIKFKRVYDEV